MEPLENQQTAAQMEETQWQKRNKGLLHILLLNSHAFVLHLDVATQ